MIITLTYDQVREALLQAVHDKIYNVKESDLDHSYFTISSAQNNDIEDIESVTFSVEFEDYPALD